LNTRLLRKRREPPPHPIVRIVRIIGGVISILVGLIMIVTPGPALVFIPFGLWLLSADFRLARRALMRVRLSARRARRRFRTYRDKREQAARDKAS
jgi:hypothetical protein